jgi:O-succinylbenzoate synthase
MSERTQQEIPATLEAWLAQWPAVQSEIEAMIAEHAERDPSLHFELTLAEIELKDVSEAVQRARALIRMLQNVGDLTSGELHATGNY